MENQNELLTNIFAAAMGLVLFAIIGMLVALSIQTRRHNKAVEQRIAKSGASSEGKTKSLQPLVKHS